MMVACDFAAMKQTTRMSEPAKKLRRHLLGVGLDNQDGHKRVTQAEDFTIAGGSAETHEKMTEVALKTCEDLRKRGKSVHNAEDNELRDIVTRHAES